MKRVVLVIPDAGPLISLGRADGLDLLLQLHLPIYLIDQVYFEVTRDPTFEDAKLVKQFVESHPHQVTVIDTQVGRLAWLERQMNPTARQRHLGEAAITDFLTNQLRELVAPSDPVLLLFEDNDVMRMNVLLRDRVHLLSTKAFLIGMERLGYLPSAEAVWTAILASGRHSSDEIVDQSAPAISRGSYWLS
jgi:hypothetical protein